MKINTKLKELIFEIVYNAVKDSTLLEVALERKIYKDKIDALFPEILVNWCLVRHYVRTGESENKKRWSETLYYTIRKAAAYSLKRNDSEKTRHKVLNEIWNERDWNESWKIDLLIDLDFERENISVDTVEYGQVINDFINEKDRLFNVLLCRDKKEIEDYIHKIGYEEYIL